jgi:hypothetical protein
VKRTPLPTAPPTLADLGVDKDFAKEIRRAEQQTPAEYDAATDVAVKKISIVADRVAGKAHRDLQRAARANAQAKLPDAGLPAGKYSTLVIDPPRPMQIIERAERRLGELVAEQGRADRLNRGGNPNWVQNGPG